MLENRSQFLESCFHYVQTVHPIGKNSTPSASISSQTKPPVYQRHLTDCHYASVHWGWEEVEGDCVLKKNKIAHVSLNRIFILRKRETVPRARFAP